jgi:hypothetical protein
MCGDGNLTEAVAESRSSSKAPSPSPAPSKVGRASWNAFLGQIDDARSTLGYSGWGDATECYFRGHADEQWSLTPSLLRAAASRTELKEIEYDLFFEFRARARELHGAMLSSWDVLFAMQHFGVPTRLLDWTESFAAALYFALEGWNDESTTRPCVWMLNPYRLNSWSREDDGGDLVSPRYLGWDPEEEEYWDYEDLLVDYRAMDFEAPVAIYPEMKNDRLQAQRGSFTIHGDDWHPLEQQVGKRNKILRKVVLEVDAIPHAREFLEQAGLDHRQLFPDLPGLATALRRKYRIDQPAAAHPVARVMTSAQPAPAPPSSARAPREVPARRAARAPTARR